MFSFTLWLIFNGLKKNIMSLKKIVKQKEKIVFLALEILAKNIFL